MFPSPMGLDHGPPASGLGEGHTPFPPYRGGLGPGHAPFPHRDGSRLLPSHLGWAMTPSLQGQVSHAYPGTGDWEHWLDPACRWIGY